MGEHVSGTARRRSGTVRLTSSVLEAVCAAVEEAERLLDGREPAAATRALRRARAAEVGERLGFVAYRLRRALGTVPETGRGAAEGRAPRATRPAPAPKAET